MANKDKGDQQPESGFLSGKITDLMRDPHGAEPSQRAKRLAEKMNARKTAKARGASDGRCELFYLVATAKRHFRKEAKGKGSHLFLARHVDKMFENAKRELKDVCPKKWLSVRGLPRLFSDALKHPELKRRAAVLISKAH